LIASENIKYGKNDCGEQLAQYLVHGVDIWLNNPLAEWLKNTSRSSIRKACVEKFKKEAL
jgi:hypothetical protein